MIDEFVSSSSALVDCLSLFDLAGLIQLIEAKGTDCIKMTDFSVSVFSLALIS